MMIWAGKRDAFYLHTTALARRKRSRYPSRMRRAARYWMHMHVVFPFDGYYDSLINNDRLKLSNRLKTSRH